jgi:hypothetical protein
VTKPSKAPTATELRPYRTFAYGVYLVLVTTVGLLIFRSVVKSVLSMSPRMPKETGVTLEVPECTTRLRGLFDDLERQRRALAASSLSKDADRRWTEFRVLWLTQLRQDEAQCGVGLKSRKTLLRAFRQLAHVEDLYTISSVQFEGEIGPSVKALEKMLVDLHSAQRVGMTTE